MKIKMEPKENKGRRHAQIPNGISNVFVLKVRFL